MRSGKKQFVFFLALIILFLPYFVCSVELRPSLYYDFTTGTDDYISHNGSVGLLFRFQKSLRLYAAYSALSDSDYKILHTGIVRVKKGVRENTDLSTALFISGGSLKDNQTSASSFALDFQGTQYLKRNMDWSCDYRFTHGSFTSKTQNNIQVVQRNRIENVAVAGEVSNNYTIHTFYTWVGIESKKLYSGFYMDLRLGTSLIYGRSETFSEGLEFICPLPRKFYFGFFYTLTQSADSINRNYFDFNISKLF